MPSRSAGFTLIELIVSVAILAIVTSVGIAGFLSFQDNQKVLSAAKEVQQLYIDAQVKARVKETPTSCSGQLEGYRVDRSGTTFSLGAKCSSATPINRSTVVISDVDVNGSMPASVLFTTQYQDISPAGEHRICFVSGTDMYEFSVTSNGQVSDVVKATSCS